MGVHCYLTELGTVVTMAAKILAVVASLASLAAAEPGYGVAYHPYGGSSSVYRSTQGLTGYGHGYHGYGYGHGYHGYGYNPAHYTYGYNIGHGYGKRSADAEPGYHGHAVSYTHRSPQGLHGHYGGYGYGGYGYGGFYGKRSADAEPGYHGHAVSYTHRSPQGLHGHYGGYGY